MGFWYSWTHIIRINSLVPSEFDFQAPWRNFNHVNRILDILALEFTEIHFFVTFGIRMPCVFPRTAVVLIFFISDQDPQKSKITLKVKNKALCIKIVLLFNYSRWKIGGMSKSEPEKDFLHQIMTKKTQLVRKSCNSN